jgi:hypothetical protein
MRRIAVVLGLCALLLPPAAWSDSIWTNQFGSVTITNAGIASTGSELMSFFGVTALPGHSLGSVSFSTGSLTSGSIWSGGTFAGGLASSFDVLGVGPWAKAITGCPSCQNPITLFVGSFVGPIKWTVITHTGKYDYVFKLSGVVSGELYGGRFVEGYMTQTIDVDQNQWFQNHKGDIRSGNVNFSVSGPEPGTLGLFATGLIVIGGAMRRKLFRV